MRLILTDSGLGGLNVAAEMLSELQSRPNPLELELLYVNAVPEAERGYNAMSTREERLTVFNQVLENTWRRFQPDLVFVACHSLSVLLPELPFVQRHPERVSGMVAVSQALLAEASDTPLVLFVTPSTAAEGTYARFLESRGTPSFTVQACPELASAISADATGKQADGLIRRFTQEAWAHHEEPESVRVFLGCTHYAFQAPRFVQALQDLGASEVLLLNPNRQAAQALLETLALSPGTRAGSTSRTCFYTPYRLPEPEARSMQAYLTPLAPELAQAVAEQRVLPELTQPSPTMPGIVPQPSLKMPMLLQHLDLRSTPEDSRSLERLWNDLPEAPEEGFLLVTRLIVEPWHNEEEPVEVQELLHCTSSTLYACVWKGGEAEETVRQWLEQAVEPAQALWEVAFRKRAEVFQRQEPVRLKRLDIPKPWGFEGWYTGVEKRGVVQVGSELTHTELPDALRLFRESWIGSCPEPLVLLKTLNPVPQEVLGDLYLEMHEEKWEVYVVTEVDRKAWPEGVGIIKAGLHPERLSEYQARHGEDWKAALLKDFREAIGAYEKLRREIDELLDEEKRRRGLDPQAALEPAVIEDLLTTVPQDLAQREQKLRDAAYAFVGDYPVQVGDIVCFPAFNLHSLRHGIRVVEFQTPHYERRIALFAQKVLTQDHWDTDAALQQMDAAVYQPPPPELQHEGGGVRVEQFVDFPGFTAHRITLEPGAAWEVTLTGQYHLLVAVGGTLLLKGPEFEQEVEALEARLMPVAAGRYALNNPGALPITVLQSAPRFRLG